MSENNPTVDQVEMEDGGQGSPIGEHLKSRATWLRALFMLLAYFLISIAGIVGTFVVVVGFLWLLFTGEINKQLQQIGQSIAGYMYQIVRYLTFNTEDKPFPFGGSWPSAQHEDVD